MSAPSRTSFPSSTSARVRRRAALVVLVLAASLSVLAASSTPAGAQAGDVGVEDGPFVEVGNPTETKAESKVWYYDGAWWSVQVTQDGTNMAGAPLGSSFIYRLDDATETWVKGAMIEKRGTAKSDVVVAGDTLYIATHKTDRNTGVSETTASNRTLMFRFKYSGGTYTSSGAPVAMSNFEMKSMTIDRTPTGELWAAWVMGDGAVAPTPVTYQVYTQSSTDNGATWSAPAPLPFPAAITTSGDIASIAAFGNQVGIMWSDQSSSPTNDGFFFTTHAANPATGAFSDPETAYAGTGVGDDHVNLKAAGGKIYAAVKTSNDTGANPLIVLLQRATNGIWTRRTAWTGRTNVTRPLLQINETTATARLWATGPLVAGENGEQGGAIFTKSVPLDSGAFDANAAGDPAMLRSGSRINDVTGSKLPVTNATGTVVLASDKVTSKRYWHSRIPAVITPSIPPGNEYIAISPCRVVNTRSQSDGPLAKDKSRTFQIKGNEGFTAQGGRPNGCAIPAGATAIEASVTAVAPTGNGYFRAWPTGTTPPEATFVNFVKAQATTNTGSLSLGVGPRELTVENKGAPADLVVDIQGYFVAPGTVDAKVYVPLTPCRIADTRRPGAGGALARDVERTFQVSGSSPAFETQGGEPGGCDVPAGAKAVEASVTATSPGNAGYFRAWPNGELEPDATFLNYSTGQATTNTGSIALGALGSENRDLRVKNLKGSAGYVIDIQGYYTDVNAVPSDRTAVRYVPGVPCRLADTRSTGDGRPFVDRESRTYQIGGNGPTIEEQGGKREGCGVPIGAAAVEASVTAVSPTGNGFFRAWPSDAAEPNATIVNFTRARATTNTGAISLGASAPELATRNFTSPSGYVIDVQGYFIAAS